MATTVRVGHAVGAGDYFGIRRAASAGYAIMLISQTLSAGLLIFAGSWLAGLVTGDAAVIALAATLMMYAAVFQYPDGLQVMSNGALRGLKDTKWPMVITVAAYWAVGMPLGYYLGILRGQGAPGLWLGLIFGLLVAAILLTWRFWRLSHHYQVTDIQNE